MKETTKNLQPHLGQVIRSIRVTLGGKDMTQGKLAELVGVSRSMITHCETSNTTPGDEVLQKIAKVFAQDPAEYRILLHKLRRASLFSRNSEVFHDIISANPAGDAQDWRLRLVTLPKVLCTTLQDAMHKISMTSTALSDITGLEDEAIRAIVHGKQAISMKDLETLCSTLKCSFDEFQILLGQVPEQMKAAVGQNRSLLHLLMTLSEACRTQSETDLTLYVENLLKAAKTD